MTVDEKLALLEETMEAENLREGMGAVSHLFDRIPDLLERMVCRGRIIFEKANAAKCENQSYREYCDWFYPGKTDYRYSCGNFKGI